MQNENNSKTVRYPLASAGRRILAKFIDILMISCLVISLGFAIFCTDPNFKWNQKLVVASWRYGLFVSLVALIFFGLLLVLPRFWHKTIGMKAMGLAYKATKDCNKTFALFKHELFIWEIIVIVAFATGWTLTGLNQYQIDSMLQGINAAFVSKLPDNIDKVCYYIGTGFSCFYGICILFLIAIIVAIIVKNNRAAFHDKYSNLCVVFLKPLVPVLMKARSNQSNIKVPGELSEENIEEIDKI